MYKTGRLIVADTGWKTCGFGAEIVASVVEKAFGALQCPPQRVTLPDCPTPTTPALANKYYPRAIHIVNIVKGMLEVGDGISDSEITSGTPLDVPDRSFAGPF